MEQIVPFQTRAARPASGMGRFFFRRHSSTLSSLRERHPHVAPVEEVTTFATKRDAEGLTSVDRLVAQAFAIKVEEKRWYRGYVIVEMRVAPWLEASRTR